MSAREKRLAENEVWFREINERLEEQTPDSAPSLIVICECDDVECVERIPLSHADYEAVRVEPTHFLVSYGHADLSVEEVVRRADTFEVVRKRGIAGEVADYLDSTDKSDPD
jgi:hypothetical protein